MRIEPLGSCNSADDTQGKIRPIDLALPVINAAEAGRPWKERYLIGGTGHERLDFLGWAANEPDSSCRARRVPSSGPVSVLYAAYDASQMTPGEAVNYVVGYSPNTVSSPVYTQSLDTWPKGEGTGDPCFWYRISPAQGPGIYSLIVLGQVAQTGEPESGRPRGRIALVETHRVLGPVEIEQGGVVLPINGQKQLSLVAELL